MASVWIRTDEDEDVAGSVRHVIGALASAKHDDQAWKWVALALHSALQGACICHVVTTASPVGAVTKTNTRDWLTYFELSRGDSKIPPPRTQLMSLPNLLKAIRKPCSAGDRGSPSGIPLSDEELAWLTQFHDDIRNQFIHFEPMGWSIEVSGICELAKIVARLIEDIADAGWAFRFKNDNWKSKLKEGLATIRNIQLNA